MKKCKVVIVPVKDKDHNKYPFVVDSFNNIRKLYKNVWIDDDEKYAHIELHNEKGIIASTREYDYNYSGIAKIPQCFINEFIASNGSIKEVLVETEEYGCNLERNNHNDGWSRNKVKINSSGEVIIHTIKTTTDIPVNAIKSLVESVAPSFIGNIGETMMNVIKESPWYIVKQWLKDNNL